MQNGFKIETAQITSSSILIYNQYYDNVPRSFKQKKNEENLSRGEYNGYFSPKTKSQVKKYISTWIQSCEKFYTQKTPLIAKKRPYLTFVTLTLPSIQNHEDNDIKRTCLAPFIQTLQRKYNVWNYFWRAESQKNNNIHFHLIIDSYIDALELRAEWNKCIEKLLYVTNFFKNHGHRDPNTTDIHQLKDKHSAAAYVLKYVSKTDGYRGIQGRIHGCSDRIRNLKPYTTELDQKTVDFINVVRKAPDTKMIEGDNYRLIIFNPKQLKCVEYNQILSKLNSYHKTIAIDLYNNREASIEEYSKARELENLEVVKNEMEQLDILYNIDNSSAFFGHPNW